MIALDTNVVVRLLTADHPRQAARARALVESESVVLATTVMLESEWVLRSGYGFAQSAIAAAFRALLGLPEVSIEEPEVLARALDWYEGGLDFADALHLASSAAAESFATFDRSLIRRAKRLGDAPRVVEP